MSAFLPNIGPTFRPRLDFSHPINRGLASHGIVTHQDAASRGVMDLVYPGTYAAPYANVPDDQIEGKYAQNMRFNSGSRNKEALLLSHLGSDWWDGRTGYTVSVLCRMHTTTSNEEDAIFGKWSALQGANDNDSRQFLLWYKSGTNVLQAYGSDGGFPNEEVSVSIEDGEWHWLGARFLNGTMHVTVDGLPVGSGFSVGTTVDDGATGKITEVFGGHTVTGSSSGSDPRFDLKAWWLWDRGLSDAELAAHVAPQTRWDGYEQPRRRNYFAPTPASGETVVISAGGLTFTGGAPLYNENVIISAGSMALTPRALIVNQSETVTVVNAALTMAGQILGINENVVITVGGLTLNGEAVTATITGNDVTIGGVSITISGQTVTIGGALNLQRAIQSLNLERAIVRALTDTFKF